MQNVAVSGKAVQGARAGVVFVFVMPNKEVARFVKLVISKYIFWPRMDFTPKIGYMDCAGLQGDSEQLTPTRPSVLAGLLDAPLALAGDRVPKVPQHIGRLAREVSGPWSAVAWVRDVPKLVLRWRRRL